MRDDFKIMAQETTYIDEAVHLQDSLEDLNGAVRPQHPETALLAEAEKYHAGRDELEKPDAATDLLSATDAAIAEQRKEEAGKAFWKEIDVSLADIIERLFEKSLRPIVLIRDDRVEYINDTMANVLRLSSKGEALGETFLKFVAEEDWNLLAENIGAMLTENRSVAVRLKSAGDKLYPTHLEALYIADSQHFSFILIGDSIHVREEEPSPRAPVGGVACLFDPQTGLPNFYLFEDRLQMAVNAENYKDIRLNKNIIAVMGISIDNLEDFRKLGLENFVMKRLAATLAATIKKSYTAAAGLKIQFWVMINDVNTLHDLEVEVEKIKAVFDEGVRDNFTIHALHTSIGVSVFPNPAKSAKKLMQQAIYATVAAQKAGGNKLIYYRDQ